MFNKKINIILLLFVMFLLACNNKPKEEDKDVESSKENEENLVQEAEKSDKNIIMFFGNSLTAGYGLDEGEDFPTLIQERIDAEGYNYTVVNAGLSGETSAGGLGRIGWVLRDTVDVFVLELGANDMLRGLPLDQIKINLQALLDSVDNKYPEAQLIVAGMQAPPNLGVNYAKEFAQIYNDLAEDNDADIIPFLLEGVAAIPELNLPDGKHPNRKGQKIVAENVWKVLEKHLHKRR